MFANAKPIDKYLKEEQEKGIKFSVSMEKLMIVKVEQVAYGDWYLYQDDKGNLWEEYFSIGD